MRIGIETRLMPSLEMSMVVLRRVLRSRMLSPLEMASHPEMPSRLETILRPEMPLNLKMPSCPKTPSRPKTPHLIPLLPKPPLSTLLRTTSQPRHPSVSSSRPLPLHTPLRARLRAHGHTRENGDLRWIGNGVGGGKLRNRKG